MKCDTQPKADVSTEPVDRDRPFSKASGEFVGQVDKFKLPWIRAAQLPQIFCSWDLAYRCTLAGWLKPVIQGKRRTIYRIEDVINCMRRIEAGELPPSRSRKSVS